MGRAAPLAASFLLACAMTGGQANAAPPLMQWSDLLSRPKPTLKPERIRYEEAPSQFAELWRPTTPGPHPVVAMIHGGCWEAATADLHIMDWAAADLAARGIAVWNIEYRRLGEPGGGYPGTYQDVGAALDRLRTEAPRRGLSLKRVVVVGHSAGGHLALWTASRRKLPRSSPLHSPNPLKVDGVVDLAGIPNLETDIATACGADTVEAMAGRRSATRPDPYADTSPAHLVPLGARQIVIHGAADGTVRPEVGAAYAARARAAGDSVDLRTPPGGHAEEIAPGTPAWEAAVTALKELLGER